MDARTFYTLTNKNTEESFTVKFVKQDEEFFSFKIDGSEVWMSLPKSTWTLGNRRTAIKGNKWDQFGNLI